MLHHGGIYAQNCFPIEQKSYHRNCEQSSPDVQQQPIRFDQTLFS